MNQTNSAPGDDQLLFGSPEVQDALLWFDQFDKIENIIERVRPIKTRARLLVKCLRAEHEARVAAEKQVSHWKNEYETLRRRHSGTLEQLAAAESANAALNVLDVFITPGKTVFIHRTQDGMIVLSSHNSNPRLPREPRKAFGATLLECITALAPAPTAEAEGGNET